MHGVAARPADADAGHDRLIFIHQFQNASFHQRHEVVLAIARTVPLVRVRRIFPLSATDHVSGAWKPGPETAGRIAPRKAAGVIEVEMCSEHDVDIFWCETRI